MGTILVTAMTQGLDQCIEHKKYSINLLTVGVGCWNWLTYQSLFHWLGVEPQKIMGGSPTSNRKGLGFQQLRFQLEKPLQVDLGTFQSGQGVREMLDVPNFILYPCRSPSLKRLEWLSGSQHRTELNDAEVKCSYFQSFGSPEGKKRWCVFLCFYLQNLPQLFLVHTWRIIAQ